MESLTTTSPVGPWTDPLGKNIVDRSTPELGDCAAPFIMFFVIAVFSKYNSILF